MDVSLVFTDCPSNVLNTIVVNTKYDIKLLPWSTCHLSLNYLENYQIKQIGCSILNDHFHQLVLLLVGSYLLASTLIWMKYHFSAEQLHFLKCTQQLLLIISFRQVWTYILYQVLVAIWSNYSVFYKMLNIHVLCYRIQSRIVCIYCEINIFW